MVWPFTGLYVRKASLGKDDAHARGAGQMITLNGMVAVMKLIEFFTAIYVQHIGTASSRTGAAKQNSFFIMFRYLFSNIINASHGETYFRSGAQPSPT